MRMGQKAARRECEHMRTSRRKILLGCLAMALAMIGDYLLGFGTFSMSNDPNVYMGIMTTVAPDWRYAVSSILGFLSVPLFAIAALELMKVMEKKFHLAGTKLYLLFKIANWSGILYFAFIHIGICMLPVMFNAGMAATGDSVASMDMVIRVLKSILVPMGLSLIFCDGFVTVGWVGMVVKGRLPVPKAALICNPIICLLLGQLLNVIVEGLDSGTESFGWLLLYLVCAMRLVGKKERI